MTTAIVIAQRETTIDQDTHQVVRVIEGEVERSYVPLKPFCEVLGTSWSAAFECIQRDEVLNSVVREIRTTAADGKQYMTLCLPIEYVNGFIFGFSTSQVRPELREKLITYKHICYQKLFEVFSQPAPSTALATLAAQVSALAAEVAQLKKNQRPRQLTAWQRSRKSRPLPIKTILAIVRQADEPITPAEVFMALDNANVRHEQVRHRMNRMAGKGLLRKVNRGYYTLPDMAFEEKEQRPSCEASRPPCDGTQKCDGDTSL